MYISIYFYSVKDLNIALLQIYQDKRWPDEFNQKTIFVTDKVNILIFLYSIILTQYDILVGFSG